MNERNGILKRLRKWSGVVSIISLLIAASMPFATHFMNMDKHWILLGISYINYLVFFYWKLFVGDSDEKDT